MKKGGKNQSVVKTKVLFIILFSVQNAPSQHVYVGPIWFLVGLHGYQVGMVPIWASYMGHAWLSYIGPTWANKSGLPI